MGFKKWLAKKGTVGGTSRWAAKGYWALKKENPNCSIEDVMQFLVEARYPDKGSQVARESLAKLIQDGQVRGLAHLVTNILNVEAGFMENTAENRELFRSIIMEELSANNVPEDDIYKLSAHFA